jgi:hypothetical protein
MSGRSRLDLKNQQQTIDRRKMIMTDPKDLIGKFFVASWGYDQTNIDFYKVVGATAKCIKIQEWSAKRDENARLVPGEGPRTFRSRTYDYETHTHGEETVTTAKVQTKKLKDGPWVSLNSYSGAGLWDGEPEADTYTYGGAGH